MSLQSLGKGLAHEEVLLGVGERGLHSYITGAAHTQIQGFCQGDT